MRTVFARSGEAARHGDYQRVADRGGGGGACRRHVDAPERVHPQPGSRAIAHPGSMVVARQPRAHSTHAGEARLKDRADPSRPALGPRPGGVHRPGGRRTGQVHTCATWSTGDRWMPSSCNSFERLCRLIGVDPAVSRRVSQRCDRIVRPARSARRHPDAAQPARPERYRRPRPGAVAAHAGVYQRAARYHLGQRQHRPRRSAQRRGAVVESGPRPRRWWPSGDAGHWFINRGDFVNRLHLPQVAVDAVQVGITSEWFRLQGQARQDQRRVTLDALLHRPENQRPQVIWARWWAYETLAHWLAAVG